MDWLESKYISMLSNRLRNYKRKSGNIINFSCPICGDSSTDRRKARGFIYSKSNKTLYHCHNCVVTKSFDKFLETVDYQLYSDYKLERIRDDKPAQQIGLEEFTAKMKKPVFMKTGPLSELKKISQLDSKHPAKIFITERKIPTKYHWKLFFCPNFFEWTNNIIPNKFSVKSLKYDQSRLIIPFINKNQNMHAFQGRSLGNVESGMRYITIVNDESIPKIYGLDDVDLNKKIYVFEGPFDSMFIPNSLATGGGDLVSTINMLPKDNLVIVYDNERRNEHTVHKMNKAIINGYNVCIWPDNLTHKDVNDMILAGMSSEFIKYIIDQNTYRDLAAHMTLQSWSRV